MFSATITPEEKTFPKNVYWKKKLENYSPFELFPERQLTSEVKPELKIGSELKEEKDRIPLDFNTLEIQKINLFIERFNATLNPHEPKFTLNMFFLVNLYIILYRYTGVTDLCIGNSGQLQGDLRDDGLPLRADLSGNPTIQDIFHRIKSLYTDAIQNIESSETLREELKPFSILFTLNEAHSKASSTTIASHDPIALDLKKTLLKHFELNLNTQNDGSIRGHIKFNTELFSSRYLERFIGHWGTVQAQILNNPAIHLSDCPIMTESEKNELTQFNATETYFKNKKYMHEVFSERAKANPEATSVVFHGATRETATWDSLEKESNILAALLYKKQIRRGKKVGISMNRSIDMITAMLAIHKTGAAIVPLDNTPGEALNFKVENTDLHALLVDNGTAPLFEKYPEIPLINVADKQAIAALPKWPPLIYKKPPFIKGDDTAAIYYTSGTTGKPKGVVVPFKGQLNLLNAHAARNPLPGSKFLCVADIKFDAMCVDLAHWVVTEGGQLHIINNTDRFDPEALTRIIKEEGINTIVLLPHIMEKLNPAELAPFVKVAITMGSAPDGKMIAEWLKYGIEIRNEYGPTENAVCSTDHPCKDGESPLSVGFPLANVQGYVVDKDNMELPPGVPGKLVLAGAGLATGYYNNPTLTRKKFFNVRKDENHRFIPVMPVKKLKPSTAASSSETKQPIPLKSKLPISSRLSEGQTRFYDTGDQFVRSYKGDLIFLGREDSQIKLKGTLTQLDPIKAAIRKHPSIADVLVIKHPNKEALVAYVVRKPLGGEIRQINEEQLLEELNSILRVEGTNLLASIDFISAIPLGPTGKINLKGLPYPTEYKKEITPPATPFQQFLIEICADFLSTKDKTITTASISASESLENAGLDSLHMYKILSNISTLLKSSSIDSLHAFEMTYGHLLDPLNPKFKGTYRSIQDIERIILSLPLIKNSSIDIQDISRKYLNQDDNASEVFITEDGGINGLSIDTLTEAVTSTHFGRNSSTIFSPPSNIPSLQRVPSETLNNGFKFD